MNTTVVSIIEMAGTMAFAISGIRLAARKHFDLFGAYVVGLVTAIGGGTIRDVMLGLTPFWMEREIYLIITAISLLLVILSGRHLLHFNNTFFIFDTVGLALFTVVGLDKTLAADFPIWVAIIMGIVTGSFGGVLRDMMVGDVPLLFRRDIYALASLIGGAVFALLSSLECSHTTCFVVAIVTVIAIRIAAVKFHLHLPILTNSSDSETEHISLHSPQREDREV